jgi:Helix-turn-helix of insertion element transposase
LDDNDEPKELTSKQKRALPYLLEARSIEEGCKRAGVSKATVYEWLKDDVFRNELKRQRNSIIDSAVDTLKANIAKATETLVKHLDSERENISIRAAESIIAFTQKALEHEELEKRIEALEARLIQQRARPSLIAAILVGDVSTHAESDGE